MMDMADFKFKDKDIRLDIKDKYGFDGDIAEIFAGQNDAVVHKWHHYIPLYDRYFAGFRSRPIRFLEIGVSKGGSLQMWRMYFGANAVIYGIDTNPACARFDGDAGQVRIGSQADPEFLKSVVAEMGGIDVVLDDGSHEMAHIKTSIETLFPMLSDGGIYMVEDLHTAYWQEFGGGYDAPENFFNYALGVVHDMHHWYHDMSQKNQAMAGQCPGVHLHDSLAVFEKSRTYRPQHSKVTR